MAQVEQGDAARGRTPPYIAFQTLKTFLDELKQHGVPSRIDRSVLTRFSGAVGSQLVGALKFLRLIDDDAHPTADLSALVTAYGTDAFPLKLREVISARYGPLLEYDLESATPSQFRERFLALYPAKEAVLRKCITFFLNASRESGVGVSQRILKNTKPRSTPAKRTRQKPNTPDPGPLGDAAKRDDPPPPRHVTEEGTTRSQVLLDLLDPQAMTEEETQAVWTLLLYIKRQPKEKAATDNASVAA